MYGFIQMSIIQQIQVCQLYTVSFWISISNRSIEKQSAYECGQEPMGDARMKFDIQYYIIGIQYQIFDQEIIFQFPQATIYMTMESQQGIWVVLIFQTIQTIGFVYEYQKGALKIKT